VTEISLVLTFGTVTLLYCLGFPLGFPPPPTGFHFASLNPLFFFLKRGPPLFFLERCVLLGHLLVRFYFFLQLFFFNHYFQVNGDLGFPPLWDPTNFFPQIFLTSPPFFHKLMFLPPPHRGFFPVFIPFLANKPNPLLQKNPFPPFFPYCVGLPDHFLKQTTEDSFPVFFFKPH